MRSELSGLSGLSGSSGSSELSELSELSGLSGLSYSSISHLSEAILFISPRLYSLKCRPVRNVVNVSVYILHGERSIHTLSCECKCVCVII